MLLRGLFIGVAFGPTFLLGIWIAVASTPWYQQYLASSWSRELSRSLGMSITVDRVRTPSSSRVELHGVRVQHPESGSDVAKIRVVEATRFGNGWTARLAQPELQGPELGNCYRLIHDWFLCRPKLVENTIHIQMDDLTVHGSAGKGTFVDVHIELGHREDQALASVRCGLADVQLGDAIKVDFARSHTLKQSQWLFQTSSTSVPVAVMADYLPPLRALGTNASFTGSIWIRHDMANRSEWRLQGRLDQLQLEELSQSLPFRLSGTAQVHIENAHVSSGRLQYFRGNMVSDHAGRIDPRWIELGSRYLGLTTGWKPSADTMPRSLEYDSLAADIEISHQGISLRGLRNDEVIVQGLESPLLVESDQIAPMPLDNLVSFLTGEYRSDRNPNGTAAALRARIAQHLPWPINANATTISVVPTVGIQR